MKYELTPDLLTGSQQIDMQHRQLFEAVNRLMDACSMGKGRDQIQSTIMLLRIQSTLAEDQMTTDAVLNNYLVTADDIAVDREGVMGVDLNDEAASLMTYQKAYTAACRLMTVLEEALDSLINSTL